MSAASLAGTFAFNKAEPIHRWYSYIEGYSSQLVNSELDKLTNESIHTVYDPFGGTGTTLLAASMRGLSPYYSETNPFMNDVSNIKINTVINICGNPSKIKLLKQFREYMQNFDYHLNTFSVSWDGFEKYYTEDTLSYIFTIKNRIRILEDKDVKSILMLALSAVAVPSSKMIRRGDLRYAKPFEKKNTESVVDLFIQKLDDMINDIEYFGHTVTMPAHALAADCREISEENLIDCVITSPPYLNGTNYIRNTKLELKLNDYVKSEADLALFHSKGIVAGINNVSKRNTTNVVLPEIQEYIDKLQDRSYDKRIPIMISNYFYDMNEVFIHLFQIMKTNAVFIMDIGDSQFAGIHIPTHDILIKLCKNNKFVLYDNTVIRTRHSKNGMLLTQRLLKFRLSK